MKWTQSFRIIISSVGLIAVLGLLSLNVVEARVAGIVAVAWSPDGSKIATSGIHGLLQILDTNGSVIWNITGLTETVNTVDWSPDSSKIVSGSDDGSVFIWNVSNGQQLATLTGAGQYLWTVDWSPDGSKILGSGFIYYSPSSFYTLIVWDAVTHEQLGTQTVGNGVDAKWSPDGTKIACANWSGSLTIFTSPLEDIPYVSLDNGENNGPISLSWSADGRKIAAGSSTYHLSTLGFTNEIEIWDFVTGKLIATYLGHRDTIDAVAFSPNGKQLASVSRDGSVRIWNTVSGQQVASFPKSKTFATSIAWSPDGSWLAYGSGRDGLQIVSAPSNATYTPGPPPTATAIPPTLSAQTLQSFLQPAICSHTCFLGLQPGITTQAELENWIIQHDVYIFTDTTGTNYEGKIRRDVSWSMDNPLLTIGSGDQIGVTVEFISGILVSIETSMKIPMVSILKAYGQPSFITYFQYEYHAVYPKQKLVFSFLENLSDNDRRYTVELTLVTDALISQRRNSLQLFSVEKCTGNNWICTVIQTATPSPER